jgi:hypothetical protein
MFRKIIEYFKQKIQSYRENKKNKEKIESINENDPFIYK